MVALLTFEHLETQQLLVFDTFFSHIYVCVFILESHYFRSFKAASQLKRNNVLKS